MYILNIRINYKNKLLKYCFVNMNSLPWSWIVLAVATACSTIFIVVICLCWKGRNRTNKSYMLNIDTSNEAQMSTDTLPNILSDKQKYLLQGIKYSSINSDGSSTPGDHFSTNILSIFKNIQKNKFATTDMDKVLVDALEDSHTESLHKKFDNSVLAIQCVEATDYKEKDETYSCISISSTDSKQTFASVVPFYNRSYSIAETFKSINSE